MSQLATSVVIIWPSVEATPKLSFQRSASTLHTSPSSSGHSRHTPESWLGIDSAKQMPHWSLQGLNIGESCDSRHMPSVRQDWRPAPHKQSTQIIAVWKVLMLWWIAWMLWGQRGLPLCSNWMQSVFSSRVHQFWMERSCFSSLWKPHVAERNKAIQLKIRSIERLHMMSQHSNSLATATVAILVHNENLLRLCTKMAAVSIMHADASYAMTIAHNFW